ncbi:MAG: autotransporter outer membrane beta-barrel domain-containing protein [Planctomycetia bacterium]|nr:autotransporter outer membrane beta-barrel domain-containing protein [Planctomycetia bacterium]
MLKFTKDYVFLVLGLLTFFPGMGMTEEEKTPAPDPIPYDWYEEGVLITVPWNDAEDKAYPYPTRQIFEINTKSDFGNGFILNQSVGTLTFSNGYSLDNPIHNYGTLRISGTGIDTTSVTLTDGTIFTGDENHSVGSIWLDNATLVWDPKTYYEADPNDPNKPQQKNYGNEKPQLRFTSLFGNGTIRNESAYTDTTEGSPYIGKNVTYVGGVISPSYWDREKVEYVNENGEKTGENKVATSGQTLTFTALTPSDHVLHLGEGGILAPVIFEKGQLQEGSRLESDRIKVEGRLHLDKMYYIQPTLVEGLKDDLENSPETITFLETTEGITYGDENRQKYAWGDATSNDFQFDFNNEESFSSPIVYSIDYKTDGNKISLKKEFTWEGNYLKKVKSTTTDLNKNIREMAWQMNEMLYQGTYSTEIDGSGYITDLPFFLNIASPDLNSQEAAYHIKQFTPEVYATRMTLTALNGIKQGDMALEQMSNGRQHQGIRSRLGRCGDGDCPDTEKREHYDPFFAQFHGKQTWYAWATPTGQWMERDTDGLLNGFFGYEYQQYGFNAGIARNLGSVTLGLSGGYQDGSFSARDTWHEIDVESFQIMFLASWYCGNWWADGWFGYNHDSDDSQRNVLIGGTWEKPALGIASAEYTLQGWSGGFHLGYNWNFSHWSVTPSVGFRFGTARSAWFQETGTRLVMEEESLGLYEVPIGLRFTRCHLTHTGWLLVPMLKAEWIARFGDQDANVMMNYFDYLSYIYGAEVPSEFHCNLKLNAMRNGFHVGVEYDGSFATDYLVHRVGATVGFVF